MKKLLSILLTSVMLFACVFGLSGCSRLFNRSGDPAYIKMTADGFKYIETRDKTKVSLVGLPEGQEEVTIPTHIDGKPVYQLGCLYGGFMWEKKYYLDFSGVKVLTVQHYCPYKYVKNITEINRLIFVDYFNCKLFLQDYTPNIIISKTNYVGDNVIVELKKGDRQSNIGLIFDEIIIPLYVEQIESGVFDGFKNTIIKTEYKSKPDGWEDGWNGDCPVEWDEHVRYVEGY